MPKPGGKKQLVFAVLRIVVCVAALTWVVYGVELHDYVVLSEGQRVRLVGETELAVHVLQDGLEVVHPREDVARGDDGAERISYGLLTALRASDRALLGLCVVIFAPVLFLQSLRFMLLLRAQEIRIRFWESVKLCCAGNFLNFVAVGTTGGDVVKAYYVSLHTDRKTEAVATVFLDRVAGLTGLLTMVAVVVLTCSREPALVAVGTLAAVMLLAVLAGAALLASTRLRAMVARLKPVARLVAVADRRPEAQLQQSRWRGLAIWLLGHARRGDQAAHRLLRHKSLVLGGLLATLGLQFIAITAFVMICYAVGMDDRPGTVFDYYAITATGCIVAAIPVSPQGLGTVEATFKHFLLGSHATLSQLLCMAMGIRLLQLLWALPGILVLLTGSYRPRVAGAELPSLTDST